MDWSQNGLLLVALLVLCTIGGCIPIPIHHDVPTETGATEATSKNIENVRLAPFYHKSKVREFERQLSDVTDDIEIVESADLWASAFPDREPDAEATLAEFMAAETLALSRALDVQSAIVINPPTSSTGEDSFVFLLAAMGGSEEESSRMSALVLDLENSVKPEQLETLAAGKSRAAWVFIPLPIINFFYWDFEADTEGSAKEGLAEAIAAGLLEDYERRPVRIAVFGALSGAGYSAVPDDESGGSNWNESTSKVHGMSNDQLEWKASHGVPEAQLQLYWNLRTSDRILWLCRSADQENPEAQKRLGILYGNAAEGVPADDTWAWVWYSKAAANGDYWSGETSDRMLTTMNEEDSARARARLRAWEPGQCKEELQEVWTSGSVPEANGQEKPPETR